MKNLKKIKKKNSGRNSTGQVVVRHQGGQHKRFLRGIDFKRDKTDVIGKVMGFEYDPNRSCDIALINYQDGDKRYIIRPENLSVGDAVTVGLDAEVKVGNAMPLSIVPIGTMVHNIELSHGKGGQMARSAGSYAIVAAREGTYVHLRLPSGEVRKVRSDGLATVGQVGNIEWKNRVLGSAGRKRHMGIRPTVRGVAMNPRSHPHGGGEGRSGIGMKSPKTYAGRKAVGKTRSPNKYSNKYILERKKRKN